MQQNIKLQIVQQFDPETDYSNYGEAEIDGAFEATVYELLQKVQNYQEPKIDIPERGDAVQWKYGKGTGQGKVTKLYFKPVTLKLGKSNTTRNGSEPNPALLITQTNGSQVLKLASEVQIVREIELEESVVGYSFDFDGKYDHIDLTPTKGMIKAAKQAQKYIESGFAGDGMESETIKWVNLVAQGRPLSLEKAKKGYKFFKRHNYYKDTKKQGDTNPNQPSPWYVARMAWFGDEGESFFNRVWRQIQAVENQTADNTETMSNEPLEFGAIIHKVIKWNGLDIGCEYKPGEVRFPGRRNSRKLRCGYGHLRGYRDNTGEAPDVYLAPEFFIDGEQPSDRIFMISQLSPEDGDFDEPKYMCGFADIDAAKAAYLREMPQDYFGGIEEIFISDLGKYKKEIDFTEFQVEVSTRLDTLTEATSKEYSELKTELTGIKELLLSNQNTEFSELAASVRESNQSVIVLITELTEKVSNLQTEFTELTIKQPETNIKADLEIIREQVAELSDKVAEFSVPLQVTGDIITTEELKEISTVDEETVQEAMADWGDDLKGNYENLLRTEEIQEEE